MLEVLSAGKFGQEKGGRHPVPISSRLLLPVPAPLAPHSNLKLGTTAGGRAVEDAWHFLFTRGCIDIKLPVARQNENVCGRVIPRPG